MEVVRNALACTSRFSAFDDDTPIVVTSDSLVAIKVAQQLAPRQVIVSRRSDTGNDNDGPTILHLDRGSQFLEPPSHIPVSSNQQEESFPVQAYYATFVDFYLLMGAQCVAYDRGGFGRLASLLSSANPACHVNHRHDQC